VGREKYPESSVSYFEEVLVMADGPGADRVRGFFSNTHLFHIMMSAYGWKPDRTASGSQ
jgi:alkaline phosphatase